MEKYCEVCEKKVETNIITTKEEYTVFGENIEVDAQVLVCSECGEEFFCEELDNETMLSVYGEYRRRRELLFPDEVKAIREQYGLSRKDFAKLLKCKEKTIRMYENGGVQSKEHNDLLLLLRK